MPSWLFWMIEPGYRRIYFQEKYFGSLARQRLLSLVSEMFSLPHGEAGVNPSCLKSQNGSSSRRQPIEFSIDIQIKDSGCVIGP